MISVIIPTYKPKEYIVECLNSLEKQTLDKDQFEVLIILNGPKEPYYSYINKELSSSNCNIRLLYSEENGVSNARNQGLEKAKGDYIAFVDDDDLVSQDYLVTLKKTLDEGGKGAIACCNVSTFDSNNNIGTDYISSAYRILKDKKYTNIFEFRRFLSSSCCKLIPKEVIKDRRFVAGIKIGEDSLFMASISDSINKIILADEAAVYYRRLRPGSASRKKEKLLKKVTRKGNLISKYIKTYFSKPFRYNVTFFLSRIVATIIIK